MLTDPRHPAEYLLTAVLRWQSHMAGNRSELANAVCGVNLMGGTANVIMQLVNPAVPAEMWPADRAAFEKYWDGQLPSRVIDDTVRDYLDALLDLTMFPLPVQLLGRRFHRFVSAGYLPRHFRDQMRHPWSPAHQRRWDGLIRETVVSRGTHRSRRYGRGVAAVSSVAQPGAISAQPLRPDSTAIDEVFNTHPVWVSSPTRSSSPGLCPMSSTV
jgi:hypothetical protein